MSKCCTRFKEQQDQKSNSIWQFVCVCGGGGGQGRDLPDDEE